MYTSQDKSRKQNKTRCKTANGKHPLGILLSALLYTRRRRLVVVQLRRAIYALVVGITPRPIYFCLNPVFTPRSNPPANETRLHDRWAIRKPCHYWDLTSFAPSGYHDGPSGRMLVSSRGRESPVQIVANASLRNTMCRLWSWNEDIHTVPAPDTRKTLNNVLVFATAVPSGSLFHSKSFAGAAIRWTMHLRFSDTELAPTWLLELFPTVVTWLLARQNFLILYAI